VVPCSWQRGGPIPLASDNPRVRGLLVVARLDLIPVPEVLLGWDVEGGMECRLVAVERVGSVQHDIRDVDCRDSRWWAISNSLKYYSQEDFTS